MFDPGDADGSSWAPVPMQRCGQCGARWPAVVVFVHGHEQCRCGYVIVGCGEGSERFGQLPG